MDVRQKPYVSANALTAASAVPHYLVRDRGYLSSDPAAATAAIFAVHLLPPTLCADGQFASVVIVVVAIAVDFRSAVRAAMVTAVAPPASPVSCLLRARYITDDNHEIAGRDAH